MTEEAIVAPRDADIGAILVEVRRLDSDAHPQARYVAETVLHDGPRSKKLATLMAIYNEHTGEIHHHTLTITHISKGSSGWTIKQSSRVTLDQNEQLDALDVLLRTRRGNDDPSAGPAIVVPIRSEMLSDDTIGRLFNALEHESNVRMLSEALHHASSNPEVLREVALASTLDPDSSRLAVAALNLSRYRAEYAELSKIVDENPLEDRFQQHLEACPWLFGSEYASRIDRRRITTDENQDFILQLSTDGYIEIVEIKRAIPAERLLSYDPSHKSYYPGVELSKVVGQVTKYLAAVDASHDTIVARYNLQTLKVRARIIIGRDGDAARIQALRNINGHLHRIEVLTYDQLKNIAQRTLEFIEKVLPTHDLPDEVTDLATATATDNETMDPSVPIKACGNLQP